MSKNCKNAPRVCKNALICALGAQFEKVSVHVFDEIDSTNTEAKRMVTDGFFGDALLVAHTQTAGRGRMGRSFYSPLATGAYFSILHTLTTPLMTPAFGCAPDIPPSPAVTNSMPLMFS